MSLAAGMASVIPLLLVTQVVPLTGVALVPVFGIVLGGTMTAAAVAARRALDALSQRSGEVEAALSLGLSERDSRMDCSQTLTMPAPPVWLRFPARSGVCCWRQGLRCRLVQSRSWFWSRSCLRKLATSRSPVNLSRAAISLGVIEPPPRHEVGFNQLPGSFPGFLADPAPPTRRS